MDEVVIFSAGYTSALRYTIAQLKKAGIPFAEKANPAVSHLILPVPSFESDGSIKGGGRLPPLLEQLSADTIIIGGNLNRPELQNYKTIDLLQDELYLAHNANITAHCAIKLALSKLPITLEDCPVLVIGWGRIGKCLAQLLQNLGAQVTIAARKEETRAMVSALGFHAIPTIHMDTGPYRVIFNTVPTMVCKHCTGAELIIDLASERGLGGLDVIWARGLPNREAPESSGKLIAESILRFISRKEYAQ